MRATSPETLPQRADAPATEAEILLKATMRLSSLQDWLSEKLDLAPGSPGSRMTTLTLCRSGMEAFRDGLGRAVSLLDGLTVDPVQVRSRADMTAVPAGGRALR